MSGNVGQDIQKSVNNTYGTIKTVFKSITSIGKIITKIAGSLIKGGYVGWIIFAIILVLIVALMIVYSFIDDQIVLESTSTNATNGHASYDAQEMINTKTYEDREKLQEEMNTIRESITEELTKKELEVIEDSLREIGDLSVKYGNSHYSTYDSTAGYQVLNNEVTILLMLERLTYSYTYTDWKPDYVTLKSIDDKILEIQEKLDAGPSENEKLDLEESLEKLQDSKELIQINYDKYLELNRKYKEKYERDFINSSKASKVSPDGKALEDKIISYFKDSYGEDLTETMEELSYFHNIIIRTFSYKKTFEGLEDCKKIEEWLENPKYTDDEFVTETDSWQSLSKIEERYRVNWELMHHEAVLQLIKYNQIANSILKNDTSINYLKNTLSAHMPIFQYVTYDNKVIEKTFYDYELYDESKFDEKGNYIYSDDFDEKLKKYTTNSDYDIDFTRISERSTQEYELEQYKIQLANQKKLTKQDKQLIVELEQKVAALEDELEDEKTSDELKQEYDENYKRVTEDMVNQDDSSRIFNPSNHDIVVDNDGSYYIDYGGRKLDSYNESIKVNEKMEKMLEYEEEKGYKYRISPSWKETDDVVDENECKREINAEVSTSMMQSSLKPLAIRTIFDSVDYTYSKTGVRSTNVEEKIAKARESVKWKRQKITRQEIIIESDGTERYGKEELVGYNYKREVSTSFSNNEACISTTIEDPDNESILIDTNVYLTDFYGQKQLATSSQTGDAPGNIAKPGERNYTEGKVKIIEYYQGDYPGPYGNSTISAGGCGPTCLAMVVDSLTTSNNGVVAMCNWAYQNGYKCPSGGSYWSLIPKGAVHFGLKVNGIARTDKNGVINALQRCHPVIMICGPGDFTKNGHFIVLTGIDSNGMVSVNDPASRKRTKTLYYIDAIMNNASSKQGISAVTFWEIY